MARHTKADSVYKVELYGNGDYMYVATHTYTLGDDGNRKYSCRNWGT